MKVVHELDAARHETHRDPRWRRRRGWFALALSPVPFLALAITLWAATPAPRKSLIEEWGHAPYTAKVLRLAEECVSGGVLPYRCETDGRWMWGDHARDILRNQAGAGPRIGRPASGLAYAERWVNVRSRELGDWMGRVAERPVMFWSLALATVLQLLGLGFAFLWSRRPASPYQVVVGADRVMFGKRSVRRHELRSCRVVDGCLLVGLSRGREFRTPELLMSERELESISQSVRACIFSSEELKTYARQHMASLRERAVLLERGQTQ